MGKKGKKNDKKSSKGKVSVSHAPKRPYIDPELIKELTKGIKDVFRFWNGDVYAGEFTLTPEGGILRQGRGKYFTADGCVFSGRWESDILVEADMFSFPESSWYQGPLEGGKYSGQGIYFISNLGTLDCVFHQGRPLGFAILTDIDGNNWEGHAVPGSLILVPRNHFFDSEEALMKRRTKVSFSSIQSQPKKHEL